MLPELTEEAEKHIQHYNELPATEQEEYVSMLTVACRLTRMRTCALTRYASKLTYNELMKVNTERIAADLPLLKMKYGKYDHLLYGACRDTCLCISTHMSTYMFIHLSIHMSKVQPALVWRREMFSWSTPTANAEGLCCIRPWFFRTEASLGFKSLLGSLAEV